MYVKINLLPKSYYEAKAAKNYTVIFVLVLIILIGAGIFWKIQIDKQIAEVQNKINIATEFKNQIDAIEQEISNRQAEVAYYQVRVDAIQKVLDYNKTIPAPFYEIAKWTYEKVQYKGITIVGSNVSISARARTYNDIARYILNLYKATDTFKSGSISLAISGMGSGIVNNGMNGMNGSMPGMGGMPGMTPSGAPQPMGAGSGFSASAIAGPAMGGPGAMPGSSMPGMSNSDPLSGGMASSAYSGTWIDFNVNATLINGLPTPPVFSLGTQNNQNNMNGMNGMGPGGMPGMSGPGMMPGGPMPGSPMPGGPGAMPGA